MTSDPPKISVILCVKDAVNTVQQSIESVLLQTEEDFELLVVDDGSVDGTVVLLQRISLTDKRIKLYLRQHEGLTRSLNFALGCARGEYIARQDADDISYPQRFARQIKWLSEKGCDLCSTLAKSDGQRVTPRFSRIIPLRIRLLLGNPFIHGSWLGRKDIFMRLGGYDQDFKYAQDFDFVIRSVEQGFRWCTVNAILYEIGSSGTQISKTHRSAQMAFGRKSRQRWAKFLIRRLCLR